jgi:hypothetical protein
MTDSTIPIQNNLGDLSIDDICLAKTLVKENPDKFTDSQINWLIKTRSKNGLTESGAILKISNKLYIHKPKFFNWFMQQKAA